MRYLRQKKFILANFVYLLRTNLLLGTPVLDAIHLQAEYLFYL